MTTSAYGARSAIGIDTLSHPFPRLVQGTMALDTLERDASFALLDGVYAAGGTAFDTAHVYGGGEAETRFGEWLAHSGLRDEITIIGKGCAPEQGEPRVTPAAVHDDLEDSLSRMKVDCIDLYLIHIDDPTVAVGPIIEALAKAVAEQKIRAYGLSNWSASRIREASAYAEVHHLPSIAASSVNYSLGVWVEPPWGGNISLSGSAMVGERAFYRDTGLPILSWSTLAGGFFSGRFRPDNLQRFTDYFDQVTARAYGSPENFARLERATRLAAEKACTPAQIALGWVIAQELAVVPLVGAMTIEQFQQNLDATELALSKEECAWLASG